MNKNQKIIAFFILRLGAFFIMGSLFPFILLLQKLKALLPQYAELVVAFLGTIILVILGTGMMITASFPLTQEYSKKNN